MLASDSERQGFDAATGFEESDKTIPIGQVSFPAEQARCIRFWYRRIQTMTGAVLSVDGGSTAH
jgi:hypothetical protein